jgi:hypothetical protein
LFVAYLNDIWRNIESKIRLFAVDCVNYRKIIIIKYVEKLESDQERLEDWTEGNEMEINPNKIKALSFTTARVKDPLNYSLGDQTIPGATCCKYLGMIIRRSH